MNLLLFKWMDNVLCRFERDNTSVAGPRESGKTILTVECAIPYAGLHALTGRELEALGTVIAEWNDDSIESLSTQWSPYTVVISDTERQAARHMKKVYNYLTGPGCMLQWTGQRCVGRRPSITRRRRLQPLQKLWSSNLVCVWKHTV